MAPKKKQEKMSLGTFLQDDNYGSWADEMEDMPLPSTDTQKSYGSAPRRDYSSMGMGGAGFERRDIGYSVREQLPLPDKPPYTAHLANLSFDVTQPDIEDFFRDCAVTSVRIVEDKMDRKPKGFGYVEFGTLDGLKAALALSGENLAGRQVRISVADPPKDRPESNRDFSDWSRKGPLPDLPGQNQRRGPERNFSNRNIDNMSDAGSDRGSRRGFGAENDGKVRDFSNWERRGPLSPAAIPDRTLGGAGRQGSKDPSRDDNFRRNSPSWGEGRSQEGSRPPRKEFSERPPPVREPTAAEMDNQWRSKMRPDAPPPKSPEPEASTPSSPAPPAAPAGRPKLNLAKRTVSEAQPTDPSASGDAKASPFGAARPVDTAAKERAVEEKRQESIRLKREADEKAKADKAEEKRLAREKALEERGNNAANVEKANENEGNEDNEQQENKPPQPKFELLRRQASGNNDMVADEANDDDDDTPNPERDTAVKPKEVVRDIPKKQNGSWRKASAPEKPAESETAALEDDGWSTVSKPKKQSNNRRNQPPRALAS